MNIRFFYSKPPGWLKVFLGLALVVSLALALVIFINLNTAKTQPLSQTPYQPSTSQQTITTTPFEPSPVDQTVGWKLYKYDQHKKYSYEIKYPPNWTLNAYPDIPGAVVNFGAAEIQSPGKSFISTGVTVLRPGGFTFEEFVKNSKEFLTNPEEENLSMFGLRAKRVTGFSTERAHPNPDFIGSYVETVYIARNSGENTIIYEISLFQTPKEDYREVFRTMLSSFDLPE